LRRLYSVLLYALAPAAVPAVEVRALRTRGYWRRMPERLGYGPGCGEPAPYWVHAASVGEVQAAVPLVRRLLERRGAPPIVVTTMTPTGADRVRDTFGDAVQHRYLPYDLPGAVRRFLDRVKPKLGIVMETELWPNLLHQCAVRDIPVVLANARISPRSAARYAHVPRLVGQTLDCITVIAAQSQADAERLVALGADATRVQVTGSIKFDIPLRASLREEGEALRREWGAVDRPVWIAASTHEGEDEQVLAAFARVREVLPGCLLILVPRHPERFARVASLCRAAGYRVVERSRGEACTGETDVYLGDTMGELLLFYAAADIAFVGGSLVAIGGHNLLEPAALGVPVVTGEHVFNFEEITELLLQAGGARKVGDARALAAEVQALLQDANLRHAIGEAAREVVARNRGALQRLLDILAVVEAGETSA
jgi:3-deoxy-D-manno-octulosonic-acid transferase